MAQVEPPPDEIARAEYTLQSMKPSFTQLNAPATGTYEGPVFVKPECPNWPTSLAPQQKISELPGEFVVASVTIPQACRPPASIADAVGSVADAEDDVVGRALETKSGCPSWPWVLSPQQYISKVFSWIMQTNSSFVAAPSPPPTVTVELDRIDPSCEP